jgi:hypothetical protein
MEYENRNHAYLSECTERAVGCGRVWQLTEGINDLICEPSKLRRMYNSSHNYELHCKNP